MTNCEHAEAPVNAQEHTLQKQLVIASLIAKPELGKAPTK